MDVEPDLAPRPTLWHDLVEALPAAEHAEIRSVLGDRLVSATEDLRSEFMALVDVLNDLNEINRPSELQSESGDAQSDGGDSVVEKRAVPLPPRPPLAPQASSLLVAEVAVLYRAARERAEERGVTVQELVGEDIAARAGKIGSGGGNRSVFAGAAGGALLRRGASAPAAENSSVLATNGVGTQNSNTGSGNGGSGINGSSNKSRRRPSSARPSRDLGGLGSDTPVGIMDLLEPGTRQKFSSLLERDVRLLEQDVDYMREVIDIAMDTGYVPFTNSAASAITSSSQSKSTNGGASTGNDSDNKAGNQKEATPPPTPREVREMADELRRALERVGVEDAHNAIVSGNGRTAGLVTRHASSPRGKTSPAKIISPMGDRKKISLKDAQINSNNNSSNNSNSKGIISKIDGGGDGHKIKRIGAKTVQNPSQNPSQNPNPPAPRPPSGRVASQRPVSGGTSYKEPSAAVDAGASETKRPSKPNNAMPNVMPPVPLAPVPGPVVRKGRPGSARRLRETVQSARGEETC